MEMYLGIDTSCYTTSLALVDKQGELGSDLRRVLKVTRGERGLQQSAALFQHVQNLPELVDELNVNFDLRRIAGIAVSTRPRPVEGSYMPVFTAGAGQARILGKALGVPVFETSHQEGHLTVGIWSARGPETDEFLAVHLSGGTTELLKVRKLKGEIISGQPLFEVELLGGTTDLHAGQFVDRVGVRLGLPFPAGPGLELLARNGAPGKGLIPSAVRGYDVSFSGPESQAQRLIDSGASGEQVARAVESCICKTLVKLIGRGVKDHGLKQVLVVGGVASNQYIRGELKASLLSAGIEAYFAEPRFSSDNAVGTALIANGFLQSSFSAWSSRKKL